MEAAQEAKSQLGTNMAQLFIPQAPDLLGPAFNLERLRQSREHLAQQGQQQRTLEQYRQDQILDSKIKTAITLGQRDPEAYKRFVEGDPQLSRIMPGTLRENPATQFMNRVLTGMGYGAPQAPQAQTSPTPNPVEFAGPMGEVGRTEPMQTDIPAGAPSSLPSQAPQPAQAGPQGLPPGVRYVPVPHMDKSGEVSLGFQVLQPGQQVEALMAQIEGAGIPQNDPRFKEFVSRYGRAMAYTGVGQNLVLDKINQELESYAKQLQNKGRAAAPIQAPPQAAPQAGPVAPVPGGIQSSGIGGVSGDVIKYEAAKTAAETQARETAQRQFGQLDAATRQRLQSYESTENAHKLVGELYRPEFVGKGFAGFIQAAQSEFQKQATAARGGKYNGGDLQGAIAGRIQEFFGTVPEDQAAFYRAILDAQDQLLRARSGAQINEREFDRLSRVLYRATDEPRIFEAAFKRFGAQLDFDIKNALKNATKSPSELLKERQGRGPVNQIGGSSPVDNLLNKYR